MKTTGNNALNSIIQISVLLSFASLAGCATTYIAPQSQLAEIAHIRVEKIDADVGELTIASIDGQKVTGLPTALLPGKHTLRITKYPPATPYMMYGLMGRVGAGMDSVSRDILFTAENDGEYIVHYSEDTGLPPKSMGVVRTSSIKRRFWIEDAKTGKTISEKN